MSSKERAEQTFRDIKKRQEARKKGEEEAKAFNIESALRSVKKANHSKSRGCRSCK